MRDDGGARAGRRHTARVLAVGIALNLVLTACGGDAGGSASSTTPTSVAAATTTAIDTVSCGGVTGLFTAASVLGPVEGWCGRWVDLARGRAVRGSTGSASVWSRRTGNHTALMVGAIHTLGQGWFGPADTPIEAALVDPAREAGVLRLHLARPDGSGPDLLASPWFRLYNPAVAAERNNDLMRNVLPGEDFYVAATDSQKLDADTLPLPVPAAIVSGTVPLYDPLETTLSAQTYAPAVGGAMVLVLGFPNDTGELSAAVGRVLTDEEARQAIERLAAAGDPEGGLAYDADVEIVIEGAAAAGMSGGPVVDDRGRLVGVLVRASSEIEGVQYVRAVRMTHIASELAAALADLPAAAQNAIGGYLED